MSFLLHESAIYVNVKLTDAGRRSLSMGTLNYSKAVLSDREIDYNIDRTGQYDISLNRVMAPKDEQPPLPNVNFDGTQVYDITNSVFSGNFITTGDCRSMGFYSGDSTVTGVTINSVTQYDLDTSKRLRTFTTTSDDLDGTNTIDITSSSAPGAGQLVFAIFQTPDVTLANLSSNAPFVALWYRATGTTSTLHADRDFPDFSPAGTGDGSVMHQYPWNGIKSFYGSASTMDVRVWNMNIVRSSSEIGTPYGASGYTAYGSTDFNGEKHYLGFDEQYRQIGILHYTNEYTGNTYSEQLIPGTVEVDIPHLLWHRHSSNPGEGAVAGHRFLDAGSVIYNDEVAGTTYTLLRDGITGDTLTVGRVYPKLKIIAITDPELLNALTYKSNRNWTLPPLNISHRSTPRTGLTTSDVAGCLVEDKTYYVTYTSMSQNTWESGVSFGYQPILHCGYIQKITGTTNSDGQSAYLSATFPAQSFPYLRSAAGMTTYSGTGWNSNSMHILMKSFDTDADPGLDNVGSYGWSIIMSGDGKYVGGEDGQDTINPLYAMQREFIVDQSDVDSASTYTLSTQFTERIDFHNSGETTHMNFGNECFFFGNIKASVKKTIFRTSIALECLNEQFNTSNNPTFDPDLDQNTYITEIGILDDKDRLVAVGKFTQPVEKNSEKYLVLHVEMDF